MRDLDLRDMAIELLQIDSEFYNRMGYDLYQKGVRISDFDLFTFVQMWGNTSGGFEGVGGCAMTNQRTYVFACIDGACDICYVYFGGRFAYTVPYSEKFMEDVKNQRVAGKSSYGKYLKTE